MVEHGYTDTKIIPEVGRVGAGAPEPGARHRVPPVSRTAAVQEQHSLRWIGVPHARAASAARLHVRDEKQEIHQQRTQHQLRQPPSMAGPLVKELDAHVMRKRTPCFYIIWPRLY